MKILSYRLIEIHIKENDNFQKNPCTPSELNQEKRLRILEGLINTPFCCRKRCVAALLQKNRINRCQFQNFSISKSPYLRADDDASSHNLSGIRQLFVRKKWGPVMDLNALILTKDQPRSNRKQWGPIADLNTILYTCSTVPKCNRKRWGPISDLSGMANVTRQPS